MIDSPVLPLYFIVICKGNVKLFKQIFTSICPRGGIPGDFCDVHSSFLWCQTLVQKHLCRAKGYRSCGRCHYLLAPTCRWGLRCVTEVIPDIWNKPQQLVVHQFPLSISSLSHLRRWPPLCRQGFMQELSATHRYLMQLGNRPMSIWNLMVCQLFNHVAIGCKAVDGKTQHAKADLGLQVVCNTQCIYASFSLYINWSQVS